MEGHFGLRNQSILKFDREMHFCKYLKLKEGIYETARHCVCIIQIKMYSLPLYNYQYVYSLLFLNNHTDLSL